MNWLLVALGAAVGAPLRFLTDRAVQKRYGSGQLEGAGRPAAELLAALAHPLLGSDVP